MTSLHTIGTVIEELALSYPSISHSSLRFLEREGLVIPTRSAGGHRLYSSADIQRIRAIKNWQAERYSLEEIRGFLDRIDESGSDDDLSSRFLQQALDGKGSEATRAILDADAAGHSLEQLLTNVLQPALFVVGDLWKNGDISVAQEKEISEIVRAILADLTNQHLGIRSNERRALAACVQGELHDLGLRMVTTLLSAQGWKVHFLGADVAPRFLAEALQLRVPEVVLLSVTLEANLSAVQAAIAEITRATSGTQLPRIIVGGAAATLHPDAIRAWGAHPAIASTAEELQLAGSARR